MRPTAKERLTLHLGWERPEHRDLAWRKEPLRDFRDCEIETDAFEVDTHLPTASDRVKGDSVGVGDVKADRIPARFSGKGGLAMRAVAKGQAFRHSVQVAAKDGPEHSTSDDKAIAISLKIELLGSRLFIRSKVMKEPLNL